ncbi:MAG: TRAP transporter small permease [Rhodobacteraceae bacterium]|nr:TRAP transporter small permease [Paracoccaceae bacterium]
MGHAALSRPKGVLDSFEETLIAALLGAMTLITFANVIARYVFNANILWALEATVFLFAWMVLLGASYAVKIVAHLGVDVVVVMLPKSVQKLLGLVAVTCCLIYALLLLKGSWDYWSNFAGLPQTTGRWFPLGFEASFLSKTWYEVNDIPMPAFLQFLSDWMNEGEAYEKLPRWIPYTILPLSMVLLVWRFVQAALALLVGRRGMLIASHEAEDEIEAAAERAAGSEGR